MNLPKVKSKKQKRLGRGYGSGKGGHTSSRGTKGQKARYKIGIMFEGTKVKKSFMKRLPFKRGKGKFKPRNNKALVVNLSYLEALPANSNVNVEFLIKSGIVKENDAKKFGVKILGDGNLTKKLNIELPISKSAAKKVEAVGGKVLIEKEKKERSKVSKK